MKELWIGDRCGLVPIHATTPSDEFAAKLLGLYDSPALPVGAGPPALDPATASVRLVGRLSSDLIERAHAELTRPPDPRPAESDPA